MGKLDVLHRGYCVISHIYNEHWNQPPTEVLASVDLSSVLHSLQADLTDIHRTAAQGLSGPRGPGLFALNAFASARKYTRDC